MARELTLSVDDELIKMCEKSEMDISEFLENCLAEHFNLEPAATLKKYEVYWTLTGKSIVKARSKSEAIDKAEKEEDISDINSEYGVSRVEEIEVRWIDMNKEEAEKSSGID